MTKNITAKGGPLDGKTFTVPDGMKTFTHHAAPGGHYKVNTKTASWQDDAEMFKKVADEVAAAFDGSAPVE